MPDMMDMETFKALKELLNYCRADEQANFEEETDLFVTGSEEEKELYTGHIISKIDLLDKFVEENDPDDII